VAAPKLAQLLLQNNMPQLLLLELSPHLAHLLLSGNKQPLLLVLAQLLLLLSQMLLN
jgi:hypothetical protein